jgi:hypothetical protein
MPPLVLAWLIVTAQGHPAALYYPCHDFGCLLPSDRFQLAMSGMHCCDEGYPIAVPANASSSATAVEISFSDWRGRSGKKAFAASSPVGDGQDHAF